MKFRESKLAHQYCVGTGLEIGGSAHNPFGLNAKNVDFTKQLTSFKKEEIRLCGEYRPVDIEATGDKIPLLDESQDFIVSSHVLEHFIDPIKTLLEWYRLVKYGGVIFMIVPHKERTFDKARQRTKLQELIDRHDGKIKLDETSHEHHSVWITEDVVELIGYMNRSGLFPNPVAIEAVQDIDDKVGNGFTIVLRKLRGKITEFSSHSEVKFSDINKNERIENQSIRSTSKLLIGILTVDAFNTACAYIRLRSPLSDLQKKGMIEIFKICEVRKRNLIIDFETIKNLDVLIIQRQFPGIFPYKNLLKKLGKDRPKIVFEIDDAFNLAPKNHPGYTYYLTINASIEEYIKNADLVTVSTQFLKSCYNQLNRNIVVLQNSLDNQIWSGYRRRITSGNPVKIIFSGTVTHFSDLQVIEDAIKKIIIEFGDRVQFLFWGNTSPNLRRYSQVKKFGEFLPDYVEYAEQLKHAEVDFAIVPLENNPFNRAKSAIKWIEYSACGIPGIYSNIDAYNRIIKNGKTGILVNNTLDEWYDAIKKLVVEQSYRKEIAQNSQMEVLKDHTVTSNSVKWLHAYQSLFPPVSIIIPVFNKVEFTRKCIKALRKYPPVGKYEIIIIDNGSTDATGDYLNSLGEPTITVIKNPTNFGFAKSCNQGAQAAAFDYLLFLNNDTEPNGNWFRPLMAILERDPFVAAVGSKLIFPNGTLQHAGVIITDNRLKADPLLAQHVYYGLPSEIPEANKASTYQTLTAACLLMRKDAFQQVGGYDEGYWNGYEDVDLCFKLREKKWKIVYQPKSIIIHHESQSGPERFAMVRQNVLRLHNKWLGKIEPDFVVEKDGSIINGKGNNIQDYVVSTDMTSGLKPFPAGMQKGMFSIVILTFNQLKFTQECVQSIQSHTPEPHEIVFIDNGSSDGTVKWLRTLVNKNSNYKLIENKENLGFSKGCNQGIEASSSEYIVLLNNDVVVAENWLGGMLECLNHRPDIGIVGPMTNNISGPQKVPSVDYSAIHKLDEYSRAFRTQNRHRRIPNRRVVGFCMLFKRQLIEEIGFLDENFGSGNFEDDDFCLRAVLAGYRNLICGDVFIHHYGSRTFIGNGIDYGSSLSGNRKIFIEKWSGEEVAQQYGGKLMVENAIVKADELFGKGDIEKATACILGALKQAPLDRSLYFKIAEMLIDVKRYQDTVDLLEALNQSDSDPMQPALLGYCEEALGNSERAQEFAERALAISPRAALPMNVMGVIAFKRGECDAAEGWFRKAIEADPGFGESYTNLGSLKWAAGDTEEAMNLFERGFILSPTINDVATAYHTAVAEMKSFEKAEVVFREARALHPHHKRIAFLLIAVLLQQEKHEAALQEIEKAMIQFGIDDGILSACLEIRNKIGPVEIDRSNRKRATVSLCMIVKNEEQHFAKCLMSIKPIVNEMIVVDTGSTDRTRNIATALGAKVYDYQWTNDFSEARNYSLSKASGDWILVLDADEVVSPLDYATLRKLARKHPAKRVAYSMVTRNYTNNPGSGGWVANEGRYAEEEAGKGWVSSTKVRLFVNDKRIQFVNPVHELVEPTLSKLGIKIKTCDVPVHHYGKLDPDKLIAKGKEYYRLGIAKIEQTQGNYNALKELAIQASEIGEYEEAVKVWRKAIELQPNDAGAHMNMGFAFLMMRQYDSAIHFSKIAMQLDPELREAELNYAGAEMIAGDVHTAVSTLEHLLEKHPDYPPAMGRLAAAYIVSGREEEGFRYIQKLNAKGFDGASALEEQARAFMAEAKFETAVLLLAAAIEKGIGNGSMNNLLAVCRSKIDGSAPICNPLDYSSYLQRQPSELHGNSAAL